MNATIHTGDALEVLRSLPEGAAQTCCTSPPYYGLRDYGAEGQIGLEPTPEAYVARLVEVFREVRRVLRPDGTLWLNLGDSYSGSGKGGNPEEGKQATNRGSQSVGTLYGKVGDTARQAAVTNVTRDVPGIPPKNLLGIPWRVAFALQADGWHLRADVVWSKPNPMPESVTDRPTRSHEYVFLLTPRARYFYDAEAVKEESDPAQAAHNARYAREYEAHTRRHEDKHNPTGQPGNVNNVGIHARPNLDGKRNLRSVWHLSTQPFPGAHFAVMPSALAERCIRAGTSERGACPACGAPWERVVEREGQGWDGSRYGERAVAAAGGAKSGGTARSTLGSTNGKLTGKTSTAGWRPTCTCPEAPPFPCAVLDPFTGAGTTGAVALRLGRSFLGAELNPGYAQMARERLSAVAPLFASVA